MSACRRTSPLLEAFVDGELASDKVLEVEQHLVECELCTERVSLSHALHLSTRRAVRADGQPSAAFQARILGTLVAERERERSAFEERRPRTRVLPWRTIVPMAAAAAATLVWAASTNHGQSRPAPFSPPISSANPTASIEELIQDFVEYHARAPAPEITEPSLLQKLEPEVGVPVRVPSLAQYGARWEGGGIVPVGNSPAGNRQAASLRYRVDGHRVTLYVYNSTRFPLRARLEPRVVRNLPVYVGMRRGYSIAAKESRGVGYAIATDLNDHESAELVASIH